MDKYLQEQLINFPSRKIPVVFCIDMSKSMITIPFNAGVAVGERLAGDHNTFVRKASADCTYETKGEKLNKCLVELNKALKDDMRTSTACLTSYVAFGNEARVLDDFSLIKYNDVPVEQLNYQDDDTYIVPGLELAYNSLMKQKQYLKDNGIDYCQPWLILLTDGVAYDDDDKIKEIKKTLQQAQKNNSLIVYSIALDDDPKLREQLRGYSIYKPIKWDTNADEMKKFFKFLLQSFKFASQNKQISHYTEHENLDILL